MLAAAIGPLTVYWTPLSDRGNYAPKRPTHWRLEPGVHPDQVYAIIRDHDDADYSPHKDWWYWGLYYEGVMQGATFAGFAPSPQEAAVEATKVMIKKGFQRWH